MSKLFCLAVALCLLAGCSHHPYGRLCSGEVSSLTGTVTGHSQAWIFDEIHDFTITYDGLTVRSGQLKTRDPALYIASATTAEGFMAQRLSPDRFRLIDAAQDRMITWSCPTSVATP